MNNELLTAGNLYGSLINDIGNILVEARGKICREINSVMVDAYWNIGKYIVEYEQKGEERAEYGSNLLNRLSKDLTRLYGKGFGKSNLLYIRKLYLYFPKEGVQKGKIPPCRIGYLISVSNRDTNKSRVPNTFWTPSFELEPLL